MDGDKRRGWKRELWVFPLDETLSGGDYAADFEFGFFEIEDEADWQAGDFEIIEHLADLVVCNALNHLGVHDNFPECDKIRDKLGYLNASVEYWITGLLEKWNFPELKFHRQPILVWLFMIAVTDFIQHGKRRANDQVCLILI